LQHDEYNCDHSHRNGSQLGHEGDDDTVGSNVDESKENFDVTLSVVAEHILTGNDYDDPNNLDYNHDDYRKMIRVEINGKSTMYQVGPH